MKILRLFPNLINDQMNLELEFEVTKEELKAILNLLKKAKSSGLNGRTIEFYIGFYALLKGDLLRMVEESRI
jgi:hypothetical protein